MSTYEERLSDAFSYVAHIHGAQARQSGVPTISHLMAVAGLVIENDGNETEIIAALLHDIVEDHGGDVQLARVREKFGPRVADLVAECCDSFPITKRERDTWRRRKREYIKKLETVSESAFKIEVADKLHNARMTYRDAMWMKNPSLWDKLGRSAEQQVAYFKVMHRLFERRYPSIQTSELGVVVARLESFCNPEGLRACVADLSSAA